MGLAPIAPGHARVPIGTGRFIRWITGAAGISRVIEPRQDSPISRRWSRDKRRRGTLWHVSRGARTPRGAAPWSARSRTAGRRGAARWSRPGDRAGRERQDDDPDRPAGRPSRPRGGSGADRRGHLQRGGGGGAVRPDRDAPGAARARRRGDRSADAARPRQAGTHRRRRAGAHARGPAAAPPSRTASRLRWARTGGSGHPRGCVLDAQLSA